MTFALSNPAWCCTGNSCFSWPLCQDWELQRLCSGLATKGLSPSPFFLLCLLMRNSLCGAAERLFLSPADLWE